MDSSHVANSSMNVLFPDKAQTVLLGTTRTVPQLRTHLTVSYKSVVTIPVSCIRGRMIVRVYITNSHQLGSELFHHPQSVYSVSWAVEV